MLPMKLIFTLQIFLGEEFNRYQAKREIKIQKVLPIISLTLLTITKFSPVEHR